MGVSTVCVCERTRQKKRKQQTKRLKTQICFVVVDNRKRLTKINDFITLKSQSIYELSITTLKIKRKDSILQQQQIILLLRRRSPNLLLLLLLLLLFVCENLIRRLTCIAKKIFSNCCRCMRNNSSSSSVTEFC